MAERTSALAGHYTVGGFGRPGDPGITLREVPGLVLHQISAWPETLVSVAAEAAVAAEGSHAVVDADADADARRRFVARRGARRQVAAVALALLTAVVL